MLDGIENWFWSLMFTPVGLLAFVIGYFALLIGLIVYLIRSFRK